MIPNNLTVKSFSFDTLIDPTLRAIDVLDEGTLMVEDIEGNQETYTFNITTLNTPLPYRLNLRIRQVISSGTTIAIGDLIGLH